MLSSSENTRSEAVTVEQRVFFSNIGEICRCQCLFFQANVATRRDISIIFFLSYVAKNVATSSSRPTGSLRRCRAAAAFSLACLRGAVRAPCSASSACLCCLHSVRSAISPLSVCVPCTLVMLQLLLWSASLLLLLPSPLLVTHACLLRLLGVPPRVSCAVRATL